jgi:hypothetical protein
MDKHKRVCQLIAYGRRRSTPESVRTAPRVQRRQHDRRARSTHEAASRALRRHRSRIRRAQELEIVGADDHLPAIQDAEDNNEQPNAEAEVQSTAQPDAVDASEPDITPSPRRSARVAQPRITFSQEQEDRRARNDLKHIAAVVVAAAAAATAAATATEAEAEAASAEAADADEDVDVDTDAAAEVRAGAEVEVEVDTDIDVDAEAEATAAEPPASQQSASSFNLSRSLTNENVSNLYNAAKVAARVPQSCIPAWVTAVRAHVINLQQQHAAGEVGEINEAWLAFMSLPARTLRTARLGNHALQQIGRVRKRIADAETEIEAVDRKFDTYSNMQFARPSTRDEQIRDLDDTAVARACKMVSEGYLSGAKRALKQDQSAAPTSSLSVVSQLKELHPQDSFALPPLPEDAVDYILDKHTDRQYFIKQMRKMDDGTSTGPSQWSGHMLRVLSEDRISVDGLMELVGYIINGKLPAEARQLITASRIIALYKDDDHVNIRPIAIGEVFYRLACRVIARIAIPLAKPLLENQHGVGENDGAAQVIHQLQTRVVDVNQPRAAIKLDLRNAFNTCDRSSMMQTVYGHEELKCMWKMVDFLYSSPSALWMQNGDGQLRSSEELQSMQGVRQGDPLSPLLFALTWQKAVKATLNAHESEDVQILSFLDDSKIVAPVGAIFDIYDTLAEEALNMGLHMQPSKCAFIYLHSETAPMPQHVADRVATNDIPSCDVITSLGVPVGAVKDEYTALIKVRIERQSMVFRRLLHKDMPKQVSFMLLRACVQLQMDYLLRTLPPTVIMPFAIEFDALVQTTAVEILGIKDVNVSALPEHKLAMTQLYLPIATGGLGLRRTVDTCHIAFLSAHVGAIRDQPEIWADINDKYVKSYSALLEVITECVHKVRNKILLPLLDDSVEEATIHTRQTSELERLLIPWPPDGGSGTTAMIDFPLLLDFYGKGGIYDTPDMNHLQTSLTRLAISSNVRAFRHTSSPLINELSKGLREGYDAHMQSLLTPHTGHWLSVTPHNAHCVIRDVSYVISARTRLYLQGHEVSLEHCSCQTFRAEMGHYKDDPIHALSCPLQRRKGITHRHDKAGDGVITGLRQGGTRVVVEQTGYDTDTSKRPDFFAVVDLIATFYEMGIVQPSAITYRNLKPLEAVRRYEKAKLKKYTQLAMDNDARIMPFILESNGGYGESARFVLSDISNMVHNQSLAFAPSEVVRDMMDAVAVAVQNGNALTIRQSFELTILDNIKRKRTMSAAQARRVGQTTLAELRYSALDDEADGDWATNNEDVL